MDRPLQFTGDMMAKSHSTVRSEIVAPPSTSADHLLEMIPGEMDLLSGDMLL